MEEIQRTEVNNIYPNQNVPAQPVLNTDVNANTVNANVQPEQTVQTSIREYRKSPFDRVYDIVWLAIGIIVVLLALRIIFLLFQGRNVGFASLVYSLSLPFAFPFQGIFPAPSAGGTYFDTAALLGMVIWPLIGFGVISMIRAFSKKAI